MRGKPGGGRRSSRPRQADCPQTSASFEEPSFVAHIHIYSVHTHGQVAMPAQVPGKHICLIFHPCHLSLYMCVTPAFRPRRGLLHSKIRRETDVTIACCICASAETDRHLLALSSAWHRSGQGLGPKRSRTALPSLVSRQAAVKLSYSLPSDRSPYIAVDPSLLPWKPPDLQFSPNVELIRLFEPQQGSPHPLPIHFQGSMTITFQFRPSKSSSSSSGLVTNHGGSQWVGAVYPSASAADGLPPRTFLRLINATFDSLCSAFFSSIEPSRTRDRTIRMRDRTNV